MSSFDLQELDALMSGYWLSDMANFSAYVYETMPDLNWVGFYLDDGKKLRLGPFMGRTACLEIAYDKGVCGKAFAQNQSLLVDDVDEFPSHIRCDARSKSELVIPFLVRGLTVGVLDVDSPTLARFTKDDQKLLETALRNLTRKIELYLSEHTTAKFGCL